MSYCMRFLLISTTIFYCVCYKINQKVKAGHQLQSQQNMKGTKVFRVNVSNVQLRPFKKRKIAARELLLKIYILP